MRTPDNFAYVILVDEHEPLHTLDHPFCWNGTCECHEDQEAVGEPAVKQQEGVSLMLDHSMQPPSLDQSKVEEEGGMA